MQRAEEPIGRKQMENLLWRSVSDGTIGKLGESGYLPHGC